MGVNVEEFYRKYSPMVLRRCRFLLKNEEQALDAMQDVFTQVLRRKETLSDYAPSSLLYTIATNTCLNMMRRKKTRNETNDDAVLDMIAHHEDHAERTILKDVLNRLFSTQHETTRLIATLHYVDKLTLEETADYVGMSVSGIRKRLAKLRLQSLELREQEL